MLWNRAGKNLLKILAKDITQLLLCTFHRPPLAQGYWSRLKCCWLCSSAALHWMAEDSQTPLFQRCYPDSRFITQRILWFSTDSHNSELWAHVGAGSAHKEARVLVKNVSGWRWGGGKKDILLQISSNIPGENWQNCKEKPLGNGIPFPNFSSMGCTKPKDADQEGLPFWC